MEKKLTIYCHPHGQSDRLCALNTKFASSHSLTGYILNPFVHYSITSVCRKINISNDCMLKNYIHAVWFVCPYALPGIDSQTVQPAVGSNIVSSMGRDTAVLLSDLTQGASNWIQSFLDPMRTTGGARSLSTMQRRTSTQRTFSHSSPPNSGGHIGYPEDFEPLRSECLSSVELTSCPIIRNPFVSPLLAPDNLLRGLPPVHIVVS